MHSLANSDSFLGLVDKLDTFWVHCIHNHSVWPPRYTPSVQNCRIALHRVARVFAHRLELAGLPGSTGRHRGLGERAGCDAITHVPLLIYTQRRSLHAPPLGYLPRAGMGVQGHLHLHATCLSRRVNHPPDEHRSTHGQLARASVPVHTSCCGEMGEGLWPPGSGATTNTVRCTDATPSLDCILSSRLALQALPSLQLQLFLVNTHTRTLY